MFKFGKCRSTEGIQSCTRWPRISQGWPIGNGSGHRKIGLFLGFILKHLTANVQNVFVFFCGRGGGAVISNIIWGTPDIPDFFGMPDIPVIVFLGAGGGKKNMLGQSLHI